MCFSATASFGASAVLLTIGIIAIKKSTTKPQYLLSCIPLLFCVQQFAEGIVWLSASHPGIHFLKQPAVYAFLIFAQVIWPVIVPLSIGLLEKEPLRKKIYTVISGIGILIALYLSYCLLFYKVSANIECYHIDYILYFPFAPAKYSGILYFIPTVIPPIISSIKSLRLLGLAVLLTYITTKIFYTEYLISVWCYFSAIISILILFIVIDMNRTKATIRL
ncbi:hypothetical protein SAMN05518672_103402 [Chitinophaga sp. CF118]|uniref:DUF6629 family protein n=1 Tax=Chitinophaga sp. CF118 TaxID=1884367 RepID=UPI0008F3AD36|nr:DUF6629 family protein [Chitinophaga sp. CF118]SFD83016.1 hypothetical protein SAMN05518672_103402 [Chitinophaga sp. CF118]